MRENNILQILREGRYTVVLSGIGLMAESGYPLLRDGAESYEIEDKYAFIKKSSLRQWRSRRGKGFTC